MSSLAELREEMAEKQRLLHNILQEAGPEIDLSRVKSIHGSNEEKAADIKARHQELADLGQKMDRLIAVESVLVSNEREYKRENEHVNEPPLQNSGPWANAAFENRAQKNFNLRRILSDHKGYQNFRAGTVQNMSLELPVIDVKALVTLATINRQATRQRDPVAMAMEERTVADLMLQGEVEGNTIEYYEETTFTNAADVVAEGDEKPESTIGYTLRNEPIRKIAHHIPATKEALDDVTFLESQIRGRLAFGVVRREEQQILNGSGSGINIRGIMNRTGLQTQAKGADPTPDAIYRAMQKVRGADGVGFAEPTAVVMHPNNWTDIKLLRTVDGIYIWGNPSDEGPDRIWGLPVRQTTAQTPGTALTGDFRFAEVLRREGIVITLSTEHGTNFTENKVTILAESRLGLAVYRPSAFATVTGL